MAAGDAAEPSVRWAEAGSRRSLFDRALIGRLSVPAAMAKAASAAEAFWAALHVLWGSLVAWTGPSEPHVRQ